MLGNYQKNVPSKRQQNWGLVVSGGGGKSGCWPTRAHESDAKVRTMAEKVIESVPKWQKYVPAPVCCIRLTLSKSTLAVEWGRQNKDESLTLLMLLYLWSEGEGTGAPGEVNFKWQVGCKGCKGHDWWNRLRSTVTILRYTSADEDVWTEKEAAWGGLKGLLLHSRSLLRLFRWWLGLMKLLLLLLLLPIARWLKMKDERVQHWKLSYLTNRRMVGHSKAVLGFQQKKQKKEK